MIEIHYSANGHFRLYDPDTGAVGAWTRYQGIGTVNVPERGTYLAVFEYYEGTPDLRPETAYRLEEVPTDVVPVDDVS
jgi:hypothetical protein